MREPAPTLPAAEARVRRALHGRRHAGLEPDLADRVVRAVASENDHGPWVEDNGRGGRRDTIRWRVRLAAQAARSSVRRQAWQETGRPLNRAARRAASRAGDR